MTGKAETKPSRLGDAMDGRRNTERKEVGRRDRVELCGQELRGAETGGGGEQDDPPPPLPHGGCGGSSAAWRLRNWLFRDLRRLGVSSRL